MTNIQPCIDEIKEMINKSSENDDLNELKEHLKMIETLIKHETGEDLDKLKELHRYTEDEILRLINSKL
ncbi:hypothetical protein [Methanococcus voltae]|uniref:Uncharacterized protein n=1 Tax=Methanococcus voltae (strain ATCC BAA-1334 / A3) TaxID=456320 RepID=D7DU18_METV3|nr:hypothetical protein [Methanococcus voltae]MCS3900428.1 uncharacterized protein YqgV (UPF0045/DUF77 family) [Methanococcus voltae]